MSKPNTGRDRRKVIEDLRKKEQAKQRRRTVGIVGACAVVGVGLVGAAAVPLWKQAQTQGMPLADIGVSVSAANCQDPVTKPANGSSNHVPIGTEVSYEAAPPAFGPHYDVPEAMTRKFFEVADRPAVETLVHNLEHGFTILWYDEALAGDAEAVEDLRAIASKFPDKTGLDDKFMVAPWTAEDGEAFPKGAHLALTHWSMGGSNGNPDEQTGVWTYCEAPSGAVVEKFIEDYPFTDAPEGTVPGEAGATTEH